MQNQPAVGAARREWIVALGLVTAVKLAWLAADPTIRIFLGDSGSYIYHAMIGTAPPDRSYTYPLLIRLFALPVQSLVPMLALQTFFGVATALFAFGIARGQLGVRFAFALALAALLATEPSQIAFERFIMAESPGTLCFVAALAAGVGYVRRPHWRWLAYGALAAFGTVSFRMSLLPVMLGMAALPPFVVLVHRWLAARHAGTGLGARAYLAAAGAMSFALFVNALAQTGYKHWYAAHSPEAVKPSYMYREGSMRLALVAPLVQPRHLEGYDLPPDLLDTVVPPLRDPGQREMQLWSGDGLVMRIKAANPTWAERIMRKIAAKALRDDVPGYFGLQWHMITSYFDADVAQARILDDLGNRGPEPGMLDWLVENTGYDGRGVAESKTPAWLAFAHSRWWLTFCLFGVVPLGIAAIARAPAALKPAATYLTLVGAGMLAAQFLFSMIVSFRYLHAFPIVVLLLAATIATGKRAVSEPSHA